jgi:hypothetical protein
MSHRKSVTLPTTHRKNKTEDFPADFYTTDFESCTDNNLVRYTRTEKCKNLIYFRVIGLIFHCVLDLRINAAIK